MRERVQKLMAQANIGSRRACEMLIEQGRVRVNGQIVTLGDKADPETDVIEVDGNRLRFDARRIYFAFNKPKQVLVTSKPHEDDDRPTALSFIPYEGHLFTIGRLDADSEGLVILTNDGELAQRLTHPRFRHTKTYRVTVQGLPTADTIQKWREGVFLDELDGRTAPCLVEIVKGGDRESVLRIVMTEGKKRQIRRVGTTLGHRVTRLVRTQVGMLELGSLREGEYRELSADEVERMSTPLPEFKTYWAQLAREKRERGGFRPDDRGDADRAARPPRRDDRGSGDRAARPPRRDGDSRPPRPYGERSGGEGRPPRRDGDSRPPRPAGSGTGAGRPPRRDGDSRPPRRDGGSGRPSAPRPYTGKQPGSTGPATPRPRRYEDEE